MRTKHGHRDLAAQPLRQIPMEDGKGSPPEQRVFVQQDQQPKDVLGKARWDVVEDAYHPRSSH